MEEDSTPANTDDGAGGNDDAAAAAAGDPSQDDSASNAADKQDDANKGDGQPSKSADDSKGGDAADEDGGADKGTDGKPGDKEPPASTFDEDLDEWAEKSGRGKPENDRERKLLQDIRNGQRDFSRDKQAKKSAQELSKSIKDAKPGADKGDEDDDGDPLEKDVKDLKEQLREEQVTRVQSEYFSSNNVTEDEAKAMGDFLKEKVEKAGAKSKEAAVAALNYWTDPDNLEDWHRMAKARLPESGTDGKDSQEIADEAARKERERIQKEHQASGSSRNASSTRTSDKTEDEKRLERFKNW